VIGALAALMMLVPSCYQRPIDAAVVDPFRAPVCAFCPGNRGLEYQPAAGTAIAAAASGVVSFSGLVAGVRYVVIDQGDGRLATYGRLATSDLLVGAHVVAGGRIGTSTERFFFGLREAGRYIDPAPFIGVPHYRPRLLPIDGSPSRRPPHPHLRCAVAP
jgi:murein DD-endopeptidase MepM/ murein hydrolase activator NlpD